MIGNVFVREQRETDIQSLIAGRKVKTEKKQKVCAMLSVTVPKTTGTDVDRFTTCFRLAAVVPAIRKSRQLSKTGKHF